MLNVLKIMKKVNVLVLGLIVAAGLSSCMKGDDFDPVAQAEAEKPVVEAYAKDKLMNPQFHELTGIWYEVESPGDPSSYNYKIINVPNSSQSYPEAPNVWVNYTGRLVQTDVVFDSNDADEGVKLSLAQVIAAWQAAFFPKEILHDEDGNLLDEPFEFGGLTPNGIKKGGVIHIVTPSHWAYGRGGQGSIPANAPLYFKIEVVDIKSPDAGSN